jgi:cytochrome c553
MTGLRSPLLLVFASAGVLLSVTLIGSRGQQPGRQDPERAFSLGDSNLDGKLSLEEFRELVTNGGRLKAAAKKKAVAPALLEPLFRRLDANGDGSLTVREFRRLSELRAGAGGPLVKKGAGPFLKGAMAKRKAAANGAAAGEPKPAPRAEAERPVTALGAKFFETKIRPVLMNKCAKCHSSTAEKLKGGLLVDSREGLRKGGDTGAAIVPGDLDESLLITAIRYTDDSLQMPPKERLPASVVADFEDWVKMGAPDPRGATAAKAPGVDLEKGGKFWSFQPPRMVKPPAVKNAAWPKTDIDRFLLASLEAKGLEPVADAERPALIRRASFDLIGLPPAPDEVESFIADTSDDAFKKVVERLLGSPRFGERWGRHWLDVARFAESSGKANMMYPNAWRYRDWVIAAFNDDKPFDAFVREQLAGDLLPAGDDRRRAELMIATGFLALGSKTHNTQNHQQFVLDLADEQIDVTTQAFLGMTVACARCHDHKFDPISQRDYYALSGVFQSTQTCYGTLPGVVQNLNPSPLIELPASAHEPSAVPRLSAERRKALEDQVAELTKERDALTMEGNFTMKGIRTRTLLAMLRFRLASFQPDGSPRIYAMGARERFEPLDSPLYIRGELESPGEVVPRGLIRLAGATRPANLSKGSGRLELAQWVGSRQNPLTARVMVNRVWLHLFGRGLVATPDNFGAAGQPPDHRELLDSLAVTFMDQGWSVKQLIRQIVFSRAYQLASSHEPRNFEADPDNALVWRMSKKRLEAEAIRDAILCASGRLIVQPLVGSAVAKAGEGVAGPNRGFNLDGQELHRAVYLPVVRDHVPDTLAVFDFADPSLVTGDRASTSGPSQALYLMNNPFILRQAEAAAERLRTSGGGADGRIKAAYLRFLSRNPTAGETERARDFLARFPASKEGGDPKRSAWTAFCQALYASAEFRYID